METKIKIKIPKIASIDKTKINRSAVQKFKIPENYFIVCSHVAVGAAERKHQSQWL